MNKERQIITKQELKLKIMWKSSGCFNRGCKKHEQLSSKLGSL